MIFLALKLSDVVFIMLINVKSSISYEQDKLHAQCLYQVMMTLHFLNDIVNDADSTRKSKIMS